MEFQDHYEVLSVPPSASHEQIERAYKRLVSIAHPDLYARDARAQAWANERMKQINAAYQVLGDSNRRVEYDRLWGADEPTAAHREKASAGEPRGSPRLRCPACEGEGRSACLTCGGAGSWDCPGCNGKHVVSCPVCHGVGRLSSEEYERLVDELLRADAQSHATKTEYGAPTQAGPTGRDPFWQVGYWDRPGPKPEMALAPVLSLVMPGAGQLYNREPQKAATYFGIAFVLFLGIGLLKGAGLVLFLVFWLYNVYDARNTSERQKQK